MLFSLCLASCSEEKDTEPLIEDEYDLFVKAIIDGEEYEYGYNFQENYRTSGNRPILDERIPGVGRNVILVYHSTMQIDIQKECNQAPGKNACIFISVAGLNTIGKNTDPIFGGVLFGEPNRVFRRGQLPGPEPLPFEVTLRNHDPIKFTIEGSFKGKAVLFPFSSGDTEERTIDIEGSFRSAASMD